MHSEEGEVVVVGRSDLTQQQQPNVQERIPVYFIASRRSSVHLLLRAPKQQSLTRGEQTHLLIGADLNDAMTRRIEQNRH